MKRKRFDIQGQVQGVGFRPHVYHIATSLKLTGWVENNAHGVSLEIQGDRLDCFLEHLTTTLPPLASIDSINISEKAICNNEPSFVIKHSQPCVAHAKITPDTSLCKDCLQELFDPESRYHLYPFINCTHCGPRYTITERLPYDRQTTSMRNFNMCAACRNAYEDPLDRRYHAQPIACQNCGPKISHRYSEIANAIRAGKVIALKSLGGFQLICDAGNAEAIHHLRKHKHRPHKPLALMVLNANSAKRLVEVDNTASELLTSQQRPIVILPKKYRPEYEAIAPNLNSLGLMLPSNGIHYRLFHALLNEPNGIEWLDEENAMALVVTSGNLSGAPLIKDNQNAVKALSQVADLIVDYDREIMSQVDDSVLTIVDNKPAFIRRARGYVPDPILLPYEIPSTLAFGGYLKNTVCLTRGKEAFVSQHLGDLSNSETIQFFQSTIQHMQTLLGVKVQCIAHDLHPDFYSSQYAQFFSLPSFAIQHHHAHIAACAIEHGVLESAIGLALDGFGLGEQQDSRGGELILYQGKDYQRLSALKPLRQPGGDTAAKQPWRMGASVLFDLGLAHEITTRFAQHEQTEAVLNLLENNSYCPKTSSCGRLFDAASAVLGICDTNSYESEAAMRLESLVNNKVVNKNGWSMDSEGLSLAPIFYSLLECDAIAGANLFHGTLVEALVHWVEVHAKPLNVTNVILSGGCFLNKYLSEWLLDALRKLHYQVYYPRKCAANDGGISLGQAWIAGNQMMEQH